MSSIEPSDRFLLMQPKLRVSNDLSCPYLLNNLPGSFPDNSAFMPLC
jgi:hypothetical protein